MDVKVPMLKSIYLNDEGYDIKPKFRIYRPENASINIHILYIRI